MSSKREVILIKGLLIDYQLMNRKFFLTIFGYNSHAGADCQEKSCSRSNTQNKKAKAIKAGGEGGKRGIFLLAWLWEELGAEKSILSLKN